MSNDTPRPDYPQWMLDIENAARDPAKFVQREPFFQLLFYAKDAFRELAAMRERLAEAGRLLAARDTEWRVEMNRAMQAEQRAERAEALADERIRAAVAAERERMCADSLRLDVLEMWWQRRLAGMCVSALDVFAEIEFCFSQDIRSAIDHAVKYGPHPEGEHGLIVDRCAAAIREGEK